MLQKKVGTCLEDLEQDGSTVLKIVLDDTYVASQASTFTIKERFYNLNLKQFKWNVQLMNQDICKKLVDLVAAGHASDPPDVIITLFRIYAISTNNDFMNSVSYWKNK